MRCKSKRVVSRLRAEMSTAPGYMRKSPSASFGARRSILLKTTRRGMSERELREQRLGRLDVLVARRIARVDDVEQQVGVGGLLERRAERREQVLRQVADEARRCR